MLPFALPVPETLEKSLGSQSYSIGSKALSFCFPSNLGCIIKTAKNQFNTAILSENGGINQKDGGINL